MSKKRVDLRREGMNMTQHLRISQFVLTWGPGSILETIRGPRIIPRPDIGLFTSSGLRPEDFEISDQRMSQGLLGGNRIFRLPSNAELGKPSTQPLYRTRPFPQWKLCHNRRAHRRKNQTGFSVLFSERVCPCCQAERRENLEPVRFVSACPEGHLDDVNWWRLVHRKGRNRNCPHSSWFMWKSAGGALSQISIECPECGSRENLGRAYGEEWPCSGRYPERENLNQPPARPRCSGSARIVQRQASNLRIPVIETLFTIPPRYTRLSNLLQLSSILDALISREELESKDELKKMLERLERRNRISRTTLEEILSYEWQEIQRTIEDVLQEVPQSRTSLLLEEFDALVEGSVQGIPPIQGPRPSSPVLIEIDPGRVVRASGPGGTAFRIVPVLRLRAVIVQTGYRREVDTQQPARYVDVSFPDALNSHQKWYPGVEFSGEGLFIMIEDGDGWQDVPNDQDAQQWLASMGSSPGYPDMVFRDPANRLELHPLFVWWHTLSHLLIRSISAEAGYPAASIRERVYLKIKDDRNQGRGGILLYAVQPGSAGVLGGLIALAPRFKYILDRAFDMLESCSGDPLCLENRFQPGGYAGAACYGCLFLSETSCEHRNMWLDRRVLRNNLP